MHPGFHAWWKHAAERRAREFNCGEGCSSGAGHGGPPRARGRGHGDGHPEGEARFGGFDDEGSAGFGVRRPLRFLAHKLELEEPQVEALATILNELKTERAQASVDNRRRIGSLADALEGESFDETKFAAAGSDQVKTEERLQATVTKALGGIHSVLQPEQRDSLGTATGAAKEAGLPATNRRALDLS